jgi:hypothetical protein
MSGSFLTTVNHCQSVAWVRHPALGAFIPLRQAVPSITENETEISFFNRDLYENFKLNPQVLSFSRHLYGCFISLPRLDGNVEFHTSFWEYIIRHMDWQVQVTV